MWDQIKYRALNILVRLGSVNPAFLETRTLQQLECREATVELTLRYRDGVLRAMRVGERALRSLGNTIPMAWIEEYREYYINILTEYDSPLTHDALRMPDPISYIRIQSIAKTSAGMYSYMTHLIHENPLADLDEYGNYSRPRYEMAAG